MSGDRAARETSGATTSLVVSYVRTHGGNDALAEVLRRSGVPHSVDELEDQGHWCSYDDRVRLFEAATEVLGDPDALFRVGSEALSYGMNSSLVLLIRAMGSPRAVYRQLPRAVAKFSTTSVMEVVDSGATHATLHYRLRPGYVHSRLDCAYARGLISMVPTIFGLAPAHLVHDECESDGHPVCVYHLTWDRRSRFRRRGRAGTEDVQLTALRAQLRDLQETAADLAASDDVQTSVRRLVERAAQAVLAPSYLLAVCTGEDRPPLVHHAGVPAEEVEELAAALLRGDDLGPGAVVVDVASARRHHGRLAALYPSGSAGMVDERSMLAAYAGYAAAALDLLLALEGARAEADRAGALLGLAHRLAGAADAGAVCREVADALPTVVGARTSSVMLWDPAAAELRGRAASGMDPERTALFLSTGVRAEDTPELMAMLGDREPRVLDAASSPVIATLLAALDLDAVAAVPLMAGGAFLGVATAGWDRGTTPTRLDGDVLARLRGVGDQAATALENARLLETVRHQAAHDALTGLPNRVLFAERLQAALARCTGPGRVAVLFCDLDRFKQVNDALGHAAGDELLRQVAARLRAVVRPGDTVGRLSGDEFALVLPNLAPADDVEDLAGRARGCFRVPFRLEGRDVPVTSSIGVAVHAGPGGTGEELLHAADAAMYLLKQAVRTPTAVSP